MQPSASPASSLDLCLESRFGYPVATGRAAMRRTIAPNSRRVRCPFRQVHFLPRGRGCRIADENARSLPQSAHFASSQDT
jgi:hypothetical protein